MKIQDLLFIFGLIVLIYIRNPRLTTLAGLALLLVSIPLFALQIFFTAEHFVWYAAALFFVACMMSIIHLRKEIHANRH